MFSCSDSSCAKHLNSSGDSGCPCSVKPSISVFSESFFFRSGGVHLDQYSRQLHVLEVVKELSLNLYFPEFKQHGLLITQNMLKGFMKILQYLILLKYWLSDG